MLLELSGLGSATRYHLLRTPTGTEFGQGLRVFVNPHQTLDHLGGLEDFTTLCHAIMEDLGLLFTQSLELRQQTECLTSVIVASRKKERTRNSM